MAYRILYESGRDTQNTGRWFRCTFLTACFFLCFLCLVSVFWPDGQALLRLLLIPGDPDITLEAAEVFAQEIGSGFSFTDAARNFWDSVMNYGNSG